MARRAGRLGKTRRVAVQRPRAGFRADMGQTAAGCNACGFQSPDFTGRMRSEQDEVVMTDPVFQFSFPPMTSTDWIILSLAALAAFSGLVMLTMPDREREEWMGWIPQPRWLFVLLALLFIPLFVLALLFAFKLLTAAISEKPIDVSFGTGALIAAILGAPFVIWRSYVAQRQANTQDEALFNDKINAAATDLAARRQVTRITMHDGNEVVLTEWEDDRAQRVAAIDRLLRLTLERPSEENRIIFILMQYARELSSQEGLWPHAGPTETSERQNWLRGKKAARSDLEIALRTLGDFDRSLNGTSGSKPFNLRNINFQGCDLRDLDYSNYQFWECHFEGANLVRTKFVNAEFLACSFEGANLFQTSFERAFFHRCNFENVRRCETALFRGAGFSSIDSKFIINLKPVWNSIFCYRDILPRSKNRPKHWVTSKIDALEFQEEWRKWLSKMATYTPPE
jgi:hypothetical protein